jgi:hypothetical protein
MAGRACQRSYARDGNRAGQVPARGGTAPASVTGLPLLLTRCPLPGCDNQVPADDPGTPCEECQQAFGNYLQPSATPLPRQSPEQVRQVLAQRDAAVRAAYEQMLQAPGESS